MIKIVTTANYAIFFVLMFLCLNKTANYANVAQSFENSIIRVKNRDNHELRDFFVLMSLRLNKTANYANVANIRKFDNS